MADNKTEEPNLKLLANKMDREKVISIILKNSSLFTTAELQNCSNSQLNSTLKALFLNFKIKK
jgi:hypothetical protein